MKKIQTLSAVICGSFLIAQTATAAPILLDDFSTFQVASDRPTAAAGSSSSSSGSMIGGVRGFVVENTTGAVGGAPVGTPGSGGATLVSTGNGQPFQITPENTLQFVTTSGQSASATVTYGLLAGGIAVGDLTAGGNDKFFFDVVEDTLNFDGTTLTTTVIDILGNSFSFVENLGLTFSEFTSFSSFVGVDFTQVGSLVFTFDTNDLAGFDASVSSISVVPLPASALLLLGGLGGLAAVGRRRRRTA